MHVIVMLFRIEGHMSCWVLGMELVQMQQGQQDIRIRKYKLYYLVKYINGNNKWEIYMYLKCVPNINMRQWRRPV